MLIRPAERADADAIARVYSQGSRNARRPSRPPHAPLRLREVGVHERHGRLDGLWRDLLLVERLLDQASGER